MPHPNVVSSIFQAVRGGAKVYALYPIVAAGKAVGVALPHDANTTAGAWGAWTQILLAAAAPAVEFWYCGYRILVTAAAITDAHGILIGSGLVATPPTPLHDEVDSIQPADGAAGAVATVNFHDHKVPYPIYQPAATPISGRSAVTTKAVAANITAAVLLATGL